MTIGLIDPVANATLDLILGTPVGIGGLLPANVYIGLLTAAPLRDGTNVVEPVGNGYHRVLVVNNLANWPAASGRRKTHSADIVFPAASGGPWGLVTHFGIFDSLSGGNLKIADALANPRQINNTDVFRFVAGVTPLALVT